MGVCLGKFLFGRNFGKPFSAVVKQPVSLCNLYGDVRTPHFEFCARACLEMGSTLIGSLPSARLTSWKVASGWLRENVYCGQRDSTMGEQHDCGTRVGTPVYP